MHPDLSVKICVKKCVLYLRNYGIFVKAIHWRIIVKYVKVHEVQVNKTICNCVLKPIAETTQGFYIASERLNQKMEVWDERK